MVNTVKVVWTIKKALKSTIDETRLHEFLFVENRKRRKTKNIREQIA